MKLVPQLLDGDQPSLNDLAAIAADVMVQADLASAGRAFDLLGRDPDLAVDERASATVIEGLVLTIEAIAEGRVADALTVIQNCPAWLATFAQNLLLAAHFPDGEIDAQQLDDANILCIAALISKAGDQALSLALLDEQRALRTAADFCAGAHMVRAWVLSVDASMASLWPRRLADDLSEFGQLRRKARGFADAGEIDKAIAAFGAAMVFPIDDTAKWPALEDLAIYAAYLRAIGQDAKLTETQRIDLALRANAPLCSSAAVRLAGAFGEEAMQLLAPGAIEDARLYFEDIARQARMAPVSAYPLRDGKPHIHVVWLEITNFCNQKCTFCPDMHREDPREWMPLETVKRTIDQLLEGTSVGSMQLNAYGEPLLHPHIDEILAYIREKKLPWPTYFTSHGMTLVDKKLKQLSNNYPQGIAISLHNDGQASYEATRSAKIGDYDTLVSRVTALFRQMVFERAPTHLRLYQMVANGREDKRVRKETRAAFPDTVERLLVHVRKWEAIAKEIARAAPPEASAVALVSDDKTVAERFHMRQETVIPILEWTDVNGKRQRAFMSTRPVDSYANLLLEYDDDWSVGRNLVNERACHFTSKPSLAVFSTGKLGICCVDMNSTATFTALEDYPDIASALRGPEAMQMISQLANGIATSRGCQICLSDDTRKCGELQTR